MAKGMDLIGQRFGRLLVIERSTKPLSSKYNYGRYWKCLCDCGNYQISNTSSLRAGRVLSCGCLQKEIAKSICESSYENLIGQRFGRLLVMERTENGMWRCICDCGNEKLIIAGSLKSGATKSCGCLARETISKLNKKELGESAFNEIFISYRSSAKKKKLSFELSREFLRNIINQPCYYCGAILQNEKKNYFNNGNYLYNGIDRIDSNVGYVEGNIVPCCIKCNKAKLVMSKEEFLSWIERVYIYSIASKFNL